MSEGRDAVVDLGLRRIGAGEPCFIAAEIGINHCGDMELARRMIDAAAECGVDAVKFQNYRTEDFLSDHSLSYEYVSRGRTVVESQYEMFKRCEIDADDLALLKEYCDRRGVVFFSTPTSAQGIDDLRRLGAPLLKNGSDYLSNLDLIRSMAESGLPTVLSTGMATAGDVDEAVRAFRESGGRDLILLHCTSCYPTPADEVNLKRIPVLREAFDCPAGFSDHTEGLAAALGAVSLGACMIEKHFTVDRELPGPDQLFSSTPDEMARLVEGVRYLERAWGSGALRPSGSEAAGIAGFRLSCVAARDIPGGTELCAGDVDFRRPGNGIPPGHVRYVLGRRTARDLPRGHVISLEDLG